MKFKCDLNFSIQCWQELVTWNWKEKKISMRKSCYLIKAGQGIRVSFIPEVCSFSIQDGYGWEYAWDKASCWRRHSLPYSQPPKPHWSFSISRQLGQKRGEMWVQTWRYSGFPPIKLYTWSPQAVNHGKLYFTTRFTRAGEILQEADCWWCWPADLLCWWTSSVLQNKSLCLGWRFSQGRWREVFPFFCRLM